MRKTLKFVTALMLMLTVILTFSVSASAESSGKVIYQNDFSTAELDDSMWYVSGGTVAVTEEYGEQFLRCTSIVGNARQVEVTFGPEEVKNVDVSLRMRARESNTHTAARMGLHFRSTTIPASQSFAYQLGFNETNMSLNLMNSHYDTQTTPIADDYNVTVRAGLWNNIKLCLRENRIVVYINGEMVCDMESDLYPAEGGIGISGVRYTFDVDDIVMTQYTGKNLPEPTPNEAPAWVGALGTDETAELADSGQERVNFLDGLNGGSDIIVDSSEVNINRIIAIALLAFAGLLAVGTVIIIILLFKKKKDKDPAPAEAEPATDQNETDKEAEN